MSKISGGRSVQHDLQLQQLRQLEQDPGFGLVLKRMEFAIEQQRNLLEGPLDAQATAEARGYIKAMRVALQIREILEKELSA